MLQVADGGATKGEAGGSQIVARYREERAKQRKQPGDRTGLGEKIIFDTLQYAMFDNVAEAVHFHADLNPDLTHIKQPVIHDWTEGERQRPVSRMSAGEFLRREQKVSNYLRSLGVRAGKRVAIISADGPNWPLF